MTSLTYHCSTNLRGPQGPADGSLDDDQAVNFVNFVTFKRELAHANRTTR